MPQSTPFAALTSRIVDAGTIPEGGLFVWQNRIYTVLAKELIPADEEGSPMITVRAIAAGWTSNPYDRWQFHLYNTERFHCDCPVSELLFNQNWEK